MPITFWVLFHVFVAAIMAFDLGLLRRKKGQDGPISTREALIRCAIYVALALAFNVFIYFEYQHRFNEGLSAVPGKTAALEFLAGYLIEQSLSVDNLFVFITIFTYFRVPARYQQKVLFWGIIGALVMRAIFIFAGVQLLEKFEWLMYVFGGLLVYTGFKMAFSGEHEIHPEHNPVLKIIRRLTPVTPDYEGDRFFVRKEGFLLATPLAVVLVVVESTDLMFAIDSIPAILAITKDPFLVYTSNVFAILGLRALYFALAGVMGLFHFLKYGLAVILMFVGCKMLVGAYYHYHLPVAISLGIVAGVLVISVLASLAFSPKHAPKLPPGTEPKPPAGAPPSADAGPAD